MRSSQLASLVLLLAVLVPVLGWKGELSASVRPIAEVLAKAESGDLVTVEGTVIETFPQTGSYVVAVLEDATGKVQVAVPESLRRNMALSPGENAVGQRFRVSGAWDHGHMNADAWGIRVQKVERLPSH